MTFHVDYDDRFPSMPPDVWSEFLENVRQTGDGFDFLPWSRKALQKIGVRFPLTLADADKILQEIYIPALKVELSRGIL